MGMVWEWCGNSVGIVWELKRDSRESSRESTLESTKESKHSFRGGGGGAMPCRGLLKFVLETLKSSYKNIENYNLQSVSIKTGPLFLTSMFVSKQLCFSRKGVQLTIHFVQFCLDISSFKVILL